ncbi:MAG TPA: thiamine pyrophosphate-dependent enzyme, partial [Pyrinomonadaceae bacterium]|nr:thiamine pyrophosphate-dependent enzyme [Pyrinomonadaceae bacterium]
RTRAEIEKHQERDPVKVFSSTLKEKGIIDDAALAEMEKSVREEVEHAFRFAEDSPQLAPEELYTDVYANPIVPRNRGINSK